MSEVLSSSEQLVVKNQQLVRMDRRARAGAAFLVTAFCLKNSGPSASFAGFTTALAGLGNFKKGPGNTPGTGPGW